MNKLKKNTGLTLIEVMIVVAILAIMSSTLFSIFQGSLLSQRRGTNKALVYSEARAALDMMSREIQDAMVDERKGIKCVGYEKGATIKTDSIADEFFWVAPMDNGGIGDLCEVGYWLKNAPSDKPPVINTLMRYYEASPPDFKLGTGGTSAQLIGNVSNLRFEYFDGSIWIPSWRYSSNPREMESLPKAVKITLVMQYEVERDQERQDTFITVVDIPGSGQ